MRCEDKNILSIFSAFSIFFYLQFLLRFLHFLRENLLTLQLSTQCRQILHHSDFS